MTDSLHVVTVGVENESAVVIRVVVRTQPWKSVVAATGREGGLMESIDKRTA